MKPGHWLILGSAIAGCAAAFAIYFAIKGSPHGDAVPQAASPRLQPAPVAKRQHSISKTISSPDTRVPGTAATAALESARDSSQPAPEFRIHGKPPAGRVSDERTWFASAEKIGRHANRELAKLRETLELSPNQQQRIFDALARNSPSWQPGMLTGGAYGVGVVGDGGKTNSPPSSEPAARLTDNPNGSQAAPPLAMNEEVMAVLDADQQQALIDEEANRRAWWEEILPQLLPPELPTAAASPPVDDPAASLPGYGDSKAYQGPTELLEE